MGNALCNDGADGGGAVPHQGCEAGQSRPIHLEVGDATTRVNERFDLLVQVRILWFKTNPTSLRSIETRCSNGDSLDGHIAEMLQQLFVGIDEIGFWQQFVPTRMFHKGLLDR